MHFVLQKHHFWIQATKPVVSNCAIFVGIPSNAFGLRITPLTWRINTCSAWLLRNLKKVSSKDWHVRCSLSTTSSQVSSCRAWAPCAKYHIAIQLRNCGLNCLKWMMYQRWYPKAIMHSSSFFGSCCQAKLKPWPVAINNGGTAPAPSQWSSALVDLFWFAYFWI